MPPGANATPVRSAMTTGASCWYIPGDGQQPAGPFTAEEIIQSWRAGRVDGNTICWREGMPQWLPLAQVEPFASATRAGRPGVSAPPRAAPPPTSPKGMPPLPVRARGRGTRSTGPLIAGGVAAGVGLLVIVIVPVLRVGDSSRPSHTSSTDSASREASGDPSAAALATIIGDYAKDLREACESDTTKIQREQAVASAVQRLEERVNECGTVTFTAEVAEIIQEGAQYAGSFRWKTRDRWGITMTVPQEFEAVVRDRTCTFGSKMWIELKREDALSIHKGDPISVQGPVTYIEGSTLGFGSNNCVEIQVWPNSEENIVGQVFSGFGDLGSPHTIGVPVSDDVTCSVGRFKSMSIHKYGGE